MSPADTFDPIEALYDLVGDIQISALAAQLLGATPGVRSPKQERSVGHLEGAVHRLARRVEDIGTAIPAERRAVHALGNIAEDLDTASDAVSGVSGCPDLDRICRVLLRLSARTLRVAKGLESAPIAPSAPAEPSANVAAE